MPDRFPTELIEAPEHVQLTTGERAVPTCPDDVARHTLKHLTTWNQASQAKIATTHAALEDLTHEVHPRLRALQGIGVDTAAKTPMVAGDNPEHTGSDAAFEKRAGIGPPRPGWG